ncbi:hypothetical protein [Agarilytica rhodophyticola]|uniref:hypothetical protein n=1 Tax=Agarilytica rhodophyticola TaxID=1737490 RepID=UPI000B346CFA|nr:hypothetical protein [Agarilytica rhodophyticola]
MTGIISQGRNKLNQSAAIFDGLAAQEKQRNQINDQIETGQKQARLSNTVQAASLAGGIASTAGAGAAGATGLAAIPGVGWAALAGLTAYAMFG